MDRFSRYSFLFLIFSVLLSVGFFTLAQAAGEEKSCDKFLNSSESDSEGLFDSTLQSLILTQENLSETQAEHIGQIYRHMKERSLPLKTMGLYPVPMIDLNTLKLMREWPLKSQPGPIRDELEANILRDPYFVWLKNNWEELRPREIREAKADYSMIPRVDGRAGPLVKGVPQNITEYLDFHLSFVGPMQLTPELLVLRLMLDHDPEIKKADRMLIFQILGAQKILYILGSVVRRLAYFEFGSDESWDEYGTYKNALAEFQALKSKVKFMLPEYSYARFSLFQNQGQLPESMSFEDYLVTHVLVKTGDPEHYQIYEKYILLKNIINFASMAHDEAILQENIEAQMDSLLPYFLY